jgi:hypothetical protein
MRVSIALAFCRSARVPVVVWWWVTSSQYTAHCHYLMPPYVSELVYRPDATSIPIPIHANCPFLAIDLKIYNLTTKPYRLNNASLFNPEPL